MSRPAAMYAIAPTAQSAVETALQDITAHECVVLAAYRGQEKSQWDIVRGALLSVAVSRAGGDSGALAQMRDWCDERGIDSDRREYLIDLWNNTTEGVDALPWPAESEKNKQLVAKLMQAIWGMRMLADKQSGSTLTDSAVERLAQNMLKARGNE